MGSSTGIGFLYSVGDKAIFQFIEIINLILSNNGKVISLKYCKDPDGDEWVEEKAILQTLTKNILYQLVGNYYGQVNVVCDLLSEKNLKIDIYFKKLDSKNLGVLLNISDEQLFESGINERIDSVTETIINLIRQIYDITNFDYAFCDNEATIEYSLDELKAIENPIYSILALPNKRDKKELQIIKSNWHIDGLTLRIG